MTPTRISVVRSMVHSMRRASARLLFESLNCCHAMARPITTAVVMNATNPTNWIQLNTFTAATVANESYRGYPRWPDGPDVSRPRATCRIGLAHELGQDPARDGVDAGRLLLLVVRAVRPGHLSRDELGHSPGLPEVRRTRVVRTRARRRCRPQPANEHLAVGHAADRHLAGLQPIRPIVEPALGVRRAPPGHTQHIPDLRPAE